MNHYAQLTTMQQVFADSGREGWTLQTAREKGLIDVKLPYPLILFIVSDLSYSLEKELKDSLLP
jgi:hypothetical protein